MPGVKILADAVFCGCEALTDVECGMLEIVGECIFEFCISLRSINLSSVRIVDGFVFNGCTALTDVKFGNKLERIDHCAFLCCHSLQRITIPLKDGLITDDGIFAGCSRLKYVDLVEGELHETIAALQLEEWRNDMNREIASINRILPATYAGSDEDDNEGGKARAMRRWIRSVLRKINHYQAQHQRILDEAENTLQLDLPQDIATNSILPFLALPSYSFEGGI